MLLTANLQAWRAVQCGRPPVSEASLHFSAAAVAAQPQKQCFDSIGTQASKHSGQDGHTHRDSPFARLAVGGDVDHAKSPAADLLRQLVLVGEPVGKAKAADGRGAGGVEVLGVRGVRRRGGGCGRRRRRCCCCSCWSCSFKGCLWLRYRCWRLRLMSCCGTRRQWAACTRPLAEAPAGGSGGGTAAAAAAALLPPLLLRAWLHLQALIEETRRCCCCCCSPLNHQRGGRGRPAAGGLLRVECRQSDHCCTFRIRPLSAVLTVQPSTMQQFRLCLFHIFCSRWSQLCCSHAHPSSLLAENAGQTLTAGHPGRFS